MSQLTNTLIIVGFATIFTFGLIYLSRKEIKKMNARGYKKLKGEKLLIEQLTR